MRVGILGCGYIAQSRHLPAIREIAGIELAALCDLSAGTLQLVADYHNVATRYTSYAEMLADDTLDAIGVLSYDHAADILAALRAGKHVMTEKPLAFTVGEAEEIKAVLAENPDLVLQVGYQKLHDPAVLWLADKVRGVAPRAVEIHDYGAILARVRGDFGPIFRVDDLPDVGGAAVRTTVAATGKAAQVNPDVASRIAATLPATHASFVETYLTGLMLGSHDFSVLNFCYGMPRQVLFAHTTGPKHLQAVLELENGALCNVDLQLGTSYGWWDERFSVYGDDDQVDLRFGNPFLAFSGTEIVTRSTVNDNDRTLASSYRGYEDGFKNEWIHFRDAVAGEVAVRSTADIAADDIRLVRDIVTRLPVPSAGS
ncbi:Gfo/Idh/MocA family oxidoreductase [Acrocarpospora macrocephala]|uniref:Oxidoreductase n=1 Tax=Acrocarpospora macrocephala TaxID=150177 RepID=A0A5M3WP50_9ACTN|nr:Gfo/Idh/MocA family oxidoreductase [Acrocarpospora macrocephala]GES11097.1 oxidoreductase [Acrocarpospora macrocephala]